jgi:hypothetical protein
MMVADKSDGYTRSERVQRRLLSLQADFMSVTGRPFEHFYCPIMLEDRDVPLCMGHIINGACPNSFKGCVVQRQDVDNFFGTFAEAAFTTNVQARSMKSGEALHDPELVKKLQPKLVVEGEVWPHYPDRGLDVPTSHTRISVQAGGGEGVHWVLKKKPEEVDSLKDTGFQLKLGRDCRLEALVSLVKAAYLTLFELLGYAYALGADGRRAGHDVLGRFFREHGSKRAEDARANALRFFRPHVNMMRTIEQFEGSIPQGTIEDRRAQACVTGDRTIFGLIVFSRANRQYYGVLMPYFDNPVGEAAYDDFMRSERQSIRVHECKVNGPTAGITVQERSSETTWPKDGKAFSFD